MNATIDVVVVRTSGCHLCDDAEAALDEFARDVPVAVRTVDAGSLEGAELIARHRPPMFPAVLVDGVLLSCGRLSRGKLRAVLERRAVEAR